MWIQSKSHLPDMWVSFYIVVKFEIIDVIQKNLPKTERDRSGIFFPFSQVSVLQRVVF